jgi:gliding motility-associated-like protein
LESKDNIEQLFKDAFEGHEEVVRPELWDGISNQIQPGSSQPSADSQTGSAGSAGSAATGAKGLSLGIWGGAALIAITATTFYLLSPTESDVNSALEVDQTTELVQPIDNSVIESEVPATPEESGSHVTPNNDPVNLTPVEDNQPENSVTSHQDDAEKMSEPQNNTVTDNHNATTGNLLLNSEQNSTDSEPSGAVEEDGAEQITEPDESQITENEGDKTTNEALSYKLTANPNTGTAPFEVNLFIPDFKGEVTWDFGDGASGFGGGSISHQYEVPGTYTAWASFTDSEGVIGKEAVIITVEADEFLKDFIPNIFTPNGDGINDTFTIKSDILKSLDLTIYDWRGRQIAHITDSNEGWDGTEQGSGRLSDEGTYFYVLFVTGNDDKTHNYKGTLKLIR